MSRSGDSIQTSKAPATKGDVISPVTAFLAPNRVVARMLACSAVFIAAVPAASSEPFLARIDVPVGFAPYRMVAGDFDEDGLTDFATLDTNSQHISVQLSLGGGRFQTSGEFTAGVADRGLAAGYLDGDGHLDLVVGSAQGASVLVLLGNGDGTFSPATVFEAGHRAAAVVIADLNGDSHNDVTAVLPLNENVVVLFGDGTGNLDPPVVHQTGFLPSAVLAAEVTGDEFIDLVTANFGSNDITVLPGISGGSFGAFVSLPAGLGTCDVALARLNDDVLWDYVAVNEFDDTVTVYYGDGMGGGVLAGTFPCGPEPRAIAVADLNGDGRDDVAVANSGGDVAVMMGGGQAALEPAVYYGVGESPLDIIVGEFTVAGRTDIAVVNYLDDDVSILRALGDGTFLSAPEFATANGPTAIAALDLDNDTVTDIVAVHAPTASVVALLGDGVGGLQPAVTPVGTELVALSTGDLNGDPWADVVACRFDSGLDVLLGNGDGTFSPGVSVPAGAQPGGVVAGFWNADAFTDLAVAASPEGVVRVYTGNGDGTFVQSDVVDVLGRPQEIVRSNITVPNGDGLLVLSGDESRVTTLLSGANGTFFGAGSFVAGVCADHLVAADFDGDGDDDVAVVDFCTDLVLLYENAGGLFFPSGELDTGAGPLDVLAADVGRTEDLDLIVTCSLSDDVHIYYGVGEGDFDEQAEVYPVGDNPVRTVPADLENRGYFDLVVANLYGGDVTVLRNLAGVVGVAESTTSSVNSAWLSPGSPNPFLGSVAWRLDMLPASELRAWIFDVRGRLVRRLAPPQPQLGSFLVSWDGTDSRGADVSAGRYFLKVTNGASAAVRSVTLLR